MLTQIETLLKGKKTYITVAAIMVLGVLQGLDVFEIKTSWWLVLGAAGLGFMRAGINKVADVVEDIKKKK